MEEHFGEPRDVEFAIAGDTVYVLQSRPVSAGWLEVSRDKRDHKKKEKRAGSPDPSTLVWSNLSVGDALPGVATPLTWSVLSESAELGFREALAALGCKVPKGVRLLGSFRGRVYLN